MAITTTDEHFYKFNTYKGEDAVFMRSQLLQQGKIQKTDWTNTLRLIDRHGDDIRYYAPWKHWLIWNGKYWELDETDSKIHSKAEETVKSMYKLLESADDAEERAEIEKFAMKSESLRKRKAFIEMAQVHEKAVVRSADVDPNHLLFNLKNGTFDIASGEFREHRREDMISKIANVEYDSAADCPRWKQFVREIMNSNVELINFLQTAAGWSLTGDTSEQVMFILFGSGANGKSTFLNVIQHILGDYAITAQTETFMKQRGDKPSNDLARLRGTRFVVTAEADQGARLSETLIKQITGGDELTARFMYGEFFNFYPTFKILFYNVAN